uniref:Uncharacterized protein n=1 Tax=Glossina brevipalpis TaxID=37001 RepID=A0A1A9W967_9MUSC
MHPCRKTDTETDQSSFARYPPDMVATVQNVPYRERIAMYFPKTIHSDHEHKCKLNDKFSNVQTKNRERTRMRVPTLWIGICFGSVLKLLFNITDRDVRSLQSVFITLNAIFKVMTEKEETTT